MITTTNYRFGEDKPNRYSICPEGVRINEGIHSQTEETGEGEQVLLVWYADTSTLVLPNEYNYQMYRVLAEQEALSAEHDELIAELMEGGLL